MLYHPQSELFQAFLTRHLRKPAGDDKAIVPAKADAATEGSKAQAAADNK